MTQDITYRHSRWVFLVRPTDSILDYLFGRMEAGHDSLTILKGLGGRKRTVIPYHHINNIDMHQGLLSLALDVGDLYIMTGNDRLEIFRCVKHPREVIRKIEERYKKK